MSASLRQRLAAARAPDPTGPTLERAAVRVLARVAVLEGVRGPARACLKERVAAALAAAGVVAVLLTGSAGSGWGRRDRRTDAAEAPAQALLAAALGGEVGARRALRASGPSGRAQLWRALEGGDGRALGLLAGGLGRLNPQELERVLTLSSRPGLREEVLARLTEAAPRGLCASLGRLLVREPCCEVDVVRALVRSAERGAKAEALEALLAGASAGRALAAAAAVELGSAATADRLLVLAPPGLLALPPVARALGAARATLQAQVLRRAGQGQETALAWAAAARLGGAVPLLFERAVLPDEARAVAALEALAAIGSTEAWLAVVRAGAAPSGSVARSLLTALDPAAGELLADRARRVVRDRPAALEALASSGPLGLAALERLAERPALAPDVLLALSASPLRAASASLLHLAQGQDSALPMVAALRRRLEAGHAEAGVALVHMATDPAQRSAVRLALDAAGPSGVVFLALVPEVERAARAPLHAPTARPATRVARGAHGAQRPY